MIKVELLGPLGNQSLECEIYSLEELGKYLQALPNIKDYLKDCAIAINDELVQDKNIVLKDGDKVSLLPPVCGG
ncbi:molybdopterin synthase sulfur carrier subunit [Helicobacter valdiviensis]|uniref:Molybdopterin synthase sulfur carrier subunit n=1 Tax=Helicobacter valdiviensis TaxID=1458358 RepID=A0A2W6MX20_9HELI|nr:MULTISPECIES: MoaD/ThiS family protein [Helicobacter]PZT49064.1 molybdopterin synthase sulfur carrier subunit [Helicobacter valdiviensis]